MGDGRLTTTKLGRYTLKRRLGFGGMAEVWEAFDETLHRTVAVKVIRDSISSETEFAERFLREARLAAQLEHPHIVPVYDFGYDDKTAYLVMPLLPGGTLKDRMQGPMEPAAALDAISAIASALDHAHGKTVLHRDVKPTNVLVDQVGRLVLADFGLAKSTVVNSEITSTGMVVGTPVYMSPEQALGYGVDGRSDQYALAVLAFELLTGRVPFVAATPIAFLQQHLQVPPPAASSINPLLPPLVDGVLARGLAKKPEDRYPSCTAFAAALGETLGITLATARWKPTAGGRVASASVPAPSSGVVAPTLASESATIVTPSSPRASRPTTAPQAPSTPPPLPRAAAELPPSGSITAPQLPSESRRSSLLPLIAAVIVVGGLIAYQIYLGRKGAVPAPPPPEPTTSRPTPPPVATATPVPAVEPTAPPISIREVGATPVVVPTHPVVREVGATPAVRPTEPPRAHEREKEPTPAESGRRVRLAKGEKKTVDATVPFRSGPVGVRIGEVTIQSVEVKDLPDDGDIRKAEKDPSRTHKVTVVFTYSNDDPDRDYKCVYGVTLLDGNGQEVGSGDQGRSLNKEQRRDTNRMSVKARTLDIRNARSMRLRFQIEVD